MSPIQFPSVTEHDSLTGMICDRREEGNCRDYDGSMILRQVERYLHRQYFGGAFNDDQTRKEYADAWLFVQVLQATHSMVSAARKIAERRVEALSKGLGYSEALILSGWGPRNA